MPAETAIVTGASSGIGAALARRLASRGVAVGLTARRESRLQALAEAIRAQGGRAVFATADAADPEATRDAVHRLAHALGPIDLLVANAGVAERNLAATFSAESLAQTFRVNLFGAAAAVEAVLPEMLQRRRGQIVGISSLAGYRACAPGHSAYCASKAALSTWLEGLRIELRGSGIAVTIVHPGYVQTEMTAGAGRRLPLVMDADRAAAIIDRGILRGRPQVDFPWPASIAMRLARFIPILIYDRILGGRFGSDGGQ